MKKLIILSAILTVALFQKTLGQNDARGLISLQYSAGFGLGDFNKFIKAPSFRGVTLEYRSLIADNIGVGFEIGWNAFYERKPYATYTKDTRSLSGVQYRYCNAVPMLISANYYFSPDQEITPFVGLGIGTQYTENFIDMGLYELSDNVWHFAIKPEIGVIFNVNEMFGVTTVAKYYGAFKSGDVGSRSYIATNIGFVWKM